MHEKWKKKSLNELFISNSKESENLVWDKSSLAV